MLQRQVAGCGLMLVTHPTQANVHTTGIIPHPTTGIIPLEVVEPMPPLLRALCRRLTRWGAPPAAREPNSAIVNIYEAVSEWAGVGGWMGGAFRYGLRVLASYVVSRGLAIFPSASPPPLDTRSSARWLHTLSQALN